MKTPTRICICTKDIQSITGKSERQCRNIIANIKKDLNKQKHQAITLNEFCQYMGINPEEVKQFIT